MNASIRCVSSTFASVLVLSVALTATFGASAETIALIGTGNAAVPLGSEFALP